MTGNTGNGRRVESSRRDFLRQAGLLGAGLVAAPALLAACGGDDGESGSGTGTGGQGTTGNAGEKLASLLKVDPANAGKGLAFPMGAVLALSGPGSFYGKTMQRGIDLAVKHIAAAGGPDMKVEYWDHKSGDAAAAKQAITEIVAKGIRVKLASYVDALGAMLEDTAKNAVFTLDGGGGTSIFGQGVPYFWGTRAITPNDAIPGALKWWLENNPDKKKIGLLGWDIGEPNNTTIKNDVLAKIEAAGMEFNGLYELTPVGSQDYAAVFPKIKNNEPDLLLVSIYGQDPGSFANQAVTAGLKAFVLGFEFTPDGINASKGTYDSQGWTFAYDYFDSANPSSDLGKLFVSEFQAAYGELPDFYAANFYENTINLWEIAMRVIAKGGDPTKGEEMDAALRENLTLTSVYGGSGATLGTYTLDEKTHSVLKRQMGVFEYKGGKVTPKAFFNLNGEDYRPA